MSPQVHAARGREIAPLFAALGDEVRLRLVAKLTRDGPMALGRLVEGEDISRQAVAKHLAVLERTGLAGFQRKGREQIWTIETGRLRDAERYLEQISWEWDRRIARLRAFVES